MNTKVRLDNVLKLLFRAFATFIIASFLFVFIPMAFIIVVGVLAAIDDNVNLVNDHALSSVQSIVIDNGHSVEDNLQRQYAHLKWSVYHADDELVQSYVRCEAVNKKTPLVTMQWFVRMQFVWDKGPKLKSNLIGAINHEAAGAAPSTVIPGRPLYASPDIAW